MINNEKLLNAQEAFSKILNKDHKSYFKDMDSYENEFYCDCGNEGYGKFNNRRNYPNKETWSCRCCGNEISVSKEPNEDNY